MEGTILEHGRHVKGSQASVCLRRRTPMPPPFSSMNSTPPDSRQRRTTSSVEPTRLVRTGLELAHSHDADARPLCEFLLAPIEEAASGPALCGRDHLLRFARATEFINSVKKRLTQSLIFSSRKRLFSTHRGKNHVRIGQSDLAVSHSKKPDRRQIIGGSDTKIIMGPRRGGADLALERKARRG